MRKEAGMNVPEYGESEQERELEGAIRIRTCKSPKPLLVLSAASIKKAWTKPPSKAT